ncbi:MAG: hypothetical protein ACR2OF_03905 [Hyphomicrobium sp.]
MAQASPVQFTPVQVLQAARRAEAEGKMEYALQFYRHLVEHHVSTAEAHEAREGLLRIAEWRWGEARTLGRQSSQPAPAAQAAQNTYTAIQGGRSAYAGEPVYEEPPPIEDQRMPQVISRDARGDFKGQEGSAFLGRYRGARFVAFVLSSLGWAGVMAGVLIAVAASVGMVAEMSAAGALGLPLGVLFGLPAVAIGLVLVVAGQIAIALFENASATLELLALERAKADG